ncbi:MAG: NADPH:quinone reductase-like Zn-dependent oxidoreductase [Gammaproteobacteria bacterium]
MEQISLECLSTPAITKFLELRLGCLKNVSKGTFIFSTWLKSLVKAIVAHRLTEMFKAMLIPETMQAVLLTGHGGPEKLVIVDDHPVPTPAHGEVLIEVTACGMNNTDVWVREGAYGTDDDPDATASWRRGHKSTLEFPRIQGTDIVGRIVSTGEGVDSKRIDERVLVDFSIYNTDTNSMVDIDYIGHGRDGGYAEYVTVPTENAYPIQSGMTDAELATFCCAYMTAEQMIDRARVAKGELTLVTGASGGVGSALVQLCKVRGAHPIAITSQAKYVAVSSLDPEVVVIRDDGNLVEVVQSAIGNRPIDVVLDVVAGPLFRDVINLLRAEGRYATAGAMAGPNVELDLRTIYLKHLEIHGSSQGTRACFQKLADLIEADKIKPLLSDTYPLSRFHEAQKTFMKKAHFGNIVLQPDSKWQEMS